MWYAIIGIIALLMVGFSLCLAAAAAMFSPDKVPASKAQSGREVCFKNGKKKLKGWFWNEEGKTGLVVVSHGMGVSVDYYMPEILAFTDKGYKVFAYDYSGYGESEGRFLGFETAVEDLKCAIDFAYDDSLPLVLFGHSMGAYASAAVGQITDKKIAATILAAPFTSPKDAVKELTSANKKIGKLMTFAAEVTRGVMFGKHGNLEAAKGILAANAPTLILQGANDKEVTVSGCALYSKRNELPPFVKSVLISDEGSDGHMTIIRRKGEKCVNARTAIEVESFLHSL